MKTRSMYIAVFLFLFTVISFAGYEFKEDGVLFYIADNNYESVHISGSFNGWDFKQNALKKIENRWEIFVPLLTGPYQYKFVIDGGKWVLDPDNESVMKDGKFDNSYIEYKSEPKKEEVIEIVEKKEEDSPINLIEFSYTDKAAESVSVVGKFNDWNIDSFMLDDADGDGIWKGKFFIEPGKYMYMIVVNGKKWYSDSNAPEFEEDGYGGKNSIITVHGER